MSSSGKVLYIMGAGRSGTTILATLLGNCASIETRGELLQLPELLEKHGCCSCGESLSACSIWSDIAAQYRDDPWFLSNAESSERHTMIPLWALPWARARARSYLLSQQQVYKRLSSYNHGAWVLDSSKYVARALLLRWLPNTKVRYIYMTRDPRGVIYSFGKAVQTSRSWPSATIYYMLINLAAEVAYRFVLKRRCIKLRYEDLIDNPDAIISRIGGFLDVNPEAAMQLLNRQMPLQVGHFVGGNRLVGGRAVRLSSDESWRTALPRWKQWAVYLLTLPFNLINRYRP